MNGVTIMFRHLPTADDDVQRYTPLTSRILPKELAGIRIQQLQSVAAGIAERLKIERVFHADNERCRLTAEMLFPRGNAQLESTKLLRNVDCPDWYGLTEAEAERFDPALYRLWHERPEEVQFRGGESLRDVFARVESLLREIKGNLFLVGNTCSMQTLLCIKLGLPPNSIWRFKPEHFRFSAVSEGVLWAFNTSDFADITFDL